MPRHPLMDLLSPVFTLFSTEDTAPVRRLVETAEDPWVRAFALHMLSQIAENEGEIDEQRRHARAAHQLFTTVGDRFGLGNVVHALGELEDITGQYDAAAAAYDEAITLARELGNDEDRPQFMMRRALLEARRGDLDAARAALHAVSGEVVDGPFGGRGDLAIALAQVERMAGNFDEARGHLQVAVAGFSTAGLALPQRRAYLEMSRAAVEIASGETAAGRTMLRDAVAAAVESRDGPIRSMVAEVAAQLAFADGDAECAALLLGVAAAQRGTIDRGAPDTLELLQRLHYSLGQAADDIQRRGRELPKDEGLARLTAFVERGAPEPAGVTGGRQVPPSARPGSR
jgi:tetratricopeptide (TPR) repeat protein